MHRFNGQGDKQWGINNAVQWHWPYFVPFNLHWYFDARCPHYSLAHRRFSHSLFKAWKKKETLPVWQRLHHCLNYLKTLMKMLGLRAGILEIHIFIFTKTMWMLSVSLTTGVDSWADALKVNCERLDRGLKRQCNNLFFMARILSSQEKPVSQTEMSENKIFFIHFIRLYEKDMKLQTTFCL